MRYIFRLFTRFSTVLAMPMTDRQATLIWDSTRQVVLNCLPLPVALADLSY
jgi:hypothetical protein